MPNGEGRSNGDATCAQRLAKFKPVAATPAPGEPC
jgi:hypothetical protein